MDTKEDDLELARKTAPVLDSPKAGDADAAFRKLVFLAAKYGLPVCNLIAMACGQEEGSTAELEAQKAALMERLKQREKDAATIADALEQAKETIAALQGQRGRGGRAWSAKHLLLATAAVIAARIGYFLASGERPSVDVSRPQTPPGFASWLASIAFVLSIAWLLAQWHRSQYLESGIGQLVMKWLLLGPGLCMSALVFFNGPPWEAELAYTVPVPALVVAVLTVLLVLSKFTERLAEKTSAKAAPFSLRGLISSLTGWFV